MTNKKLSYSFVKINPNNIEHINIFAKYYLHYLEEVDGFNNISLKHWEKLNRTIYDINNDEHDMWLVYNKDNYSLAGLCGLSTRGELSPGYILPEFRGKGLHSEMVQFRLSHGGWFTSVHINNEYSNKTFRRLNFVLVKEYKEMNRYIYAPFINNN